MIDVTTKAEKLYAVMTDSRRGFRNEVLARLHPSKVGHGKFWTDCEPGDVWQMPLKTAEEVRGGLEMNNPRIVRIQKALAMIEGQIETREMSSTESRLVPPCDDNDFSPI